MRRFFSGLGRLIDGLMTITGRIIFLLVLAFVLLLIFSSPATVTVPSTSALVWAPTGVISEQRSPAAASDLMFGTGLPQNSLMPELLESLAVAENDGRIGALVIDVSELLGVSPAQLETLGDALQRFADTGKPIYAFGEYFTQAQYALASYADNITLHPMGNLMVTGFGGNQLYFRDLLERLNVQVHVFRVGEFKSAAEPFSRMDMSEEARADNQNLLNALWSRYLTRVAGNREMSTAQLQSYADNYPALLEAANGNMARVAFEQGLVDNIADANSFRRQVAAEVGVSNGSFSQIHYLDYLNATFTPQVPGTDQVGVIVAEGTIMPGEQPLGMIGADSLTALIQQAQQDASIRAVVLRVDSPGGSALASEQIRGALDQLQLAGKPLVVSMGGQAASGGYWISASADQIWASPSTVTGSIGVIGMIPTFERALSELGVGVDGVGTTELTRAGDPLSGLNEPMRRVFQSSIDDTYARFINLVAEGRDLPREDVENIAGGRVWSGEQALEIGLVDQLGDLDQAIAAAAELAELDDYERVYLSRPLTFGEQLLLQLADSMGSAQILSNMMAAQNMPASFSGLAAVLPALSAEQRLRWQSLLNLVLPANHRPDQLRTLMLCDDCLAIK